MSENMHCCFLPSDAESDLLSLAEKLGRDKSDVLSLAVIAGLQQLSDVYDYKAAASWNGQDFKKRMLEMFV